MRSFVVVALFAISLFALLMDCRAPETAFRCRGQCGMRIVAHVDPKFTPTEQLQVWEGLYAWTVTTNGEVCFFGENAIPELDPIGYREISIIRLEDSTELLDYRDYEFYKHMGLYYDGKILIVVPRVEHQDRFAATVAHEAGHAMGLMHNTDRSAVMHDSPAQLEQGHVSPWDVVAFRRKWCR